MTSAMPNSTCSALMSWRIWAWTVTSSAVVGSSAISTRGPAGRAPWRSWRAGACRRKAGAGSSPAPPRGSRISTRARSDRASARASALGDGAMGPDRFGDLVADGEDRVEGGHRVLEHHGGDRAAKSAPACGGRRRASRSRRATRRVARMRAGRLAQEAQHRHAGDRFAGAGLAHNAEATRPPRREAQAPRTAWIDAVRLREAHLEVLNLDQRHRICLRLLERAPRPGAGRGQRPHSARRGARRRRERGGIMGVMPWELGSTARPDRRRSREHLDRMDQRHDGGVVDQHLLGLLVERERARPRRGWRRLGPPARRRRARGGGGGHRCRRCRRSWTGRCSRTRRARGTGCSPG